MYEMWALHSRTLWFYMCNTGQLSDSLASLDGKANGIVKLRHSKEDWRNQ